MSKRDVHYITIFSDASFKDNVGGWGCWIKSDFGRLTHGGPLHFVENPNHAELLAACHALSHAYLNNHMPMDHPKRHMVVFGIDNKHVMGLLNGHHHYNRVEKEILEKMHELRKLGNFKWYAKHVKAHSGTDTPRKWVNDLCDKISKQQRKAIL